MEAAFASPLDPDLINSIASMSFSELERVLLGYKDLVDAIDRGNEHAADPTVLHPLIPFQMAYPDHVYNVISPRAQLPLKGSADQLYLGAMGGSPFAASDYLKQLLMYAHCVTIDDALQVIAFAMMSRPFGKDARGYRALTESVLAFILEIRPLIDSGVVDLRQPMLALHELIREVTEVETDAHDTKAVFEGLHSVSIEMVADAVESKGFSPAEARAASEVVMRDLKRSYLTAAVADVQAQLFSSTLFGARHLFLPTLRHVMATSLLGVDSGSARNTNRLRALVSVDVPGISEIPISSLVAIRKNSDSLAEWRGLLGRALSESLDVADGDERLTNIEEGLVATIVRLKKELSSSKIRDRIRTELRGFTIGALGAAILNQNAYVAGLFALAIRATLGLAIDPKAKPARNSASQVLLHHCVAFSRAGDIEGIA
jgi:hypothetical protein